jgi:hypothetical protein
MALLTREVVVQLLVLAGLGSGVGIFIVRWAKLPASFLPMLVLAGACLASYALFFLWIVSAPGATLATRVVFACSVAAALAQCRRWRPENGWTEALAPAAQMLALCLAYLFLTGAVPGDPAGRFELGLPNDNVLPRYLADLFDEQRFNRAAPAPLVDDYRTSDRPPLQAAVTLAERSLVPGYRYATYRITGTLCQIGWVLALLPLMAMLRLTRRERAFVLTAVVCSGFTYLNTVYVWPKLLAAWLFLGAVAVLLACDSEGRGADARRVVVAGLLAALSLLAHGGVAFSVLTLPILALLFRPPVLRSVRALAPAAILAAAILTPWAAYQRFIDPPGNRLLKMHLAGVDPIDERGVVRTLVDQYAATPWSALAEARLDNVRKQWLVLSGAPTTSAAAWIQWQQFFHHVPLLDVTAVGLVCLLAANLRRSRNDGEPAIRALLIYGLVTWLVWVLILFKGQSALVHQGSYANTLLLLTLGGLGLARLAAPWAYLALTAHLAVFAIGWLANPASPSVRLDWWLTGIAALLGSLAASWRLQQESDSVRAQMSRRGSSRLPT